MYYSQINKQHKQTQKKQQQHSMKYFNHIMFPLIHISIHQYLQSDLYISKGGYSRSQSGYVVVWVDLNAIAVGFGEKTQYNKWVDQLLQTENMETMCIHSDILLLYYNVIA